MSSRILASVGALAVVAAVVSVAPVLAAGQAPKTAAKTWAAPRTADGQPDLQGVWSNATVTPFERPKELAEKPFLTEQEAAEFEKQQVQRRNFDRAPREGDTGTYNQFWWDFGTKVVGTRRTSLVLDPPDGKLPPLAPEGKKVAAWERGWDSWKDRSMWERCLTRGLPNAMIPGPYNNTYQILQTPGYVAIVIEMIHDVRVIPLDGRPHGNVRQYFGDSRGHWEGNTLVVDTVNFTDQYVTGFGANFPGSGGTPALHLVERFTRVDADTIDYQFTFDDPAIFTRPWTASISMRKTQDQLFEYACHEGNYALPGILAGARVQEKAAQEAAKKGSN